MSATTWTETSRRLATVVLVVLCLLAVPAVASAKFSSPQGATQTVSTGHMVEPTGVFGTYSCDRGALSESITVVVLGFADRGPDGAWYSYRLTRGSTLADTATTGSRFALLGGVKAKDNQSTTWTLTIQTVLNNWTSDTFTRTITCPATGGRDGLL